MPTTYKFANFFDTEITQGLSAGAEVITVTPSAAEILPLVLPDSSVQIQLTLWDGQQLPEIVAVVENPQTGTLGVLRGQEGTTAKAWSAGTQIYAALTAEVINAALAAFFDINAVIAATFLPLAGGTLTGPLILPALDPVVDNEAARKSYVDNVQGTKLDLSGGVMAGDINMDDNRILSLPAPVTPAEPATKEYTDDLVADTADPIMDFLNDISGSLISSGSATAYTVVGNRTIGNAQLVDGLRVTFRPHVASGASPTLKYGTSAARAIKTKAGIVIPTGALKANIPYGFVYKLSDTSWYLMGSIDVQTLSSLLATDAEITNILKLSGTSHLQLPFGTTAQRPAVPTIGLSRFNSTLLRQEVYRTSPPVWHGLGMGIVAASGLVITVSGNTTMTVVADAVCLVDTNNNAIIHKDVNITINLNTEGLNGRDTGVPANDTDYYIWLVSDGEVVGGLLHAVTSTNPTAPAGFSFTGRFGWARTNPSTNFYRSKQIGNEAQYTVGTIPANSRVVDNGAVGTYSSTNPVLASKSLSGFVPATAQSVQLSVTNCYQNAAISQVLVAPNTSWGGTGNGILGASSNLFPVYLGTGVNSCVEVNLVLEAHSFAWASAAAGGAVAVLGWREKFGR